jgi:hypothetical protein
MAFRMVYERRLPNVITTPIVLVCPILSHHSYFYITAPTTPASDVPQSSPIAQVAFAKMKTPLISRELAPDWPMPCQFLV